MVNWIRPTSAELAQTVQQVMDDPTVEDDLLVVPAGDPRRIALGTVLRGHSSRDGADIASGGIRGAGGRRWRVHPAGGQQQGAGQACQHHAQELDASTANQGGASGGGGCAGVETQRKQLRKWGKVMVDDPDVALKSARQLLEGVPVVSMIIKNLDLVHGRSLEVQHIFDRVAIDSEHWLLEHNTSGGLNSSVGAAAVAAAAVKQAAESSVAAAVKAALAAAAVAPGGRGRAGGGRGRRRKAKAEGRARQGTAWSTNSRQRDAARLSAGTSTSQASLGDSRMPRDLMEELPALTLRSWARAGPVMRATSLTWTSQEREERGMLS